MLLYYPRYKITRNYNCLAIRFELFISFCSKPQFVLSRSTSIERKKEKSFVKASIGQARKTRGNSSCTQKDRLSHVEPGAGN